MAAVCVLSRFIQAHLSTHSRKLFLHFHAPAHQYRLGTVQYLLKGRAGGKAKFDEKKLPALRSIK
jgi:hypothetical protein